VSNKRRIKNESLDFFLELSFFAYLRSESLSFRASILPNKLSCHFHILENKQKQENWYQNFASKLSICLSQADSPIM
jgi:hypothetical protein